jgi:DNA repair protein RadA/Sms
LAKQKKIYVCKVCGATSSKWLGKCPYCGEWNTYEEQIKQDTSSSKEKKSASQIYRLEDISEQKEKRIPTPISELNRVLGGGVVEGSVILIAGEPGIGKSTLLLQLALSEDFVPTIYVSGEESLAQIKMRADRIATSDQANTYFTTEKDIDSVLKLVAENNAKVVIIDSIQTILDNDNDFLPGSVSQIKAVTQKIIEFAKENGVAFLLVGHITKEGSVAGPKVLEHMVDAVFNFEGDRNFHYRLLRPYKNRFGSTTELAVFEMTGEGLREVTNPSEFLTQDSKGESGIAISAILEGYRIFFVEVQALVTPSVYGSPQRVVSGYDPKKLSMLLAVLEKRNKMKLGNKDVFLNITGGIKVSDTAIDLAVVAAIISSYFDDPIDENTVFAGEIGLAGEIRPVKKIADRINEAMKLGYKKFVTPKNPNIKISSYKKIGLTFVNRTYMLFQEVFKRD